MDCSSKRLFGFSRLFARVRDRKQAQARLGSGPDLPALGDRSQRQDIQSDSTSPPGTSSISRLSHEFGASISPLSTWLSQRELAHTERIKCGVTTNSDSELAEIGRETFIDTIKSKGGTKVADTHAKLNSSGYT